MKVLVTGADGYIGVMLAPFLMERGHKVTGVDTGFFRSGWLYNAGKQFPQMICKDIRKIEEADLAGFDAVIHLAELSNDPLGELIPEITYKINHEGSARLAQLAKKAGVQRFIYSSSCSVYGAGNNDWKTEDSETNPQTVYAECKVLVEKAVARLADDSFSPTFLRNATAYGPSPRMRFDIVLNNLSGLAWTTKEIKMTSDGTPWRPLVHVLDIAQAMALALEAPRETIHNQVLNVGENSENYHVKDIAEIVAEQFSGQVSFGASNGDNRSYRVSFDKIHRVLPNFRAKYSLRDGVQQLYSIFERIDMTPEIFSANPYTRLKQLQYLLRVKEINNEFYWRCP